MSAALLVALAYVAGSVPTGVLVARRRGVDLRQVGSGNIGATNVGRALGKGWAILVLGADALKGFAPVWAARRLFPTEPVVVAAVGLGAIVGHMFTLFLRGRGGKGVATSLGVSLALSPWAGLAGLALYGLLAALTRVSAVGSLAGVWSFPVFATWLGPLPRPILGLSLLTAALVTLRHAPNLRALVGARAERRRSLRDRTPP